MADISQYTPLPTVQAIYQAYEAKPRRHRPHLGASQIGHHCDRYLWYQFYWCESPQFDGRMRRLFERGDLEEKRIVADLRAIGATVYEVDPETGRQFTFTAFGGHFGCSLDGALQGIPESSKWHSLEIKTSNDKNFVALKRDGVQKNKPQHYAQMQVGMELADLDRALYLAVNKNTDEIYGERIRRSSEAASRFLSRAERVIFTEDPLERVSERPDWYQCKFCEMQGICHQGKVPEVNCRTCLHSTAERDGTWSCAQHGVTLTIEAQRKGCEHHLFRPSLVPDEPVDAGDDYVEYSRGWRNGPRGPQSYTSHEGRAAEQLPLPDEMDQVRQAFDAEVIG